MVSNDDMVIVDGVQYRPEDVPGKVKATDAKGAEVKTGPVTPDDMVEIDGRLYRPEDVPADRKTAETTSAVTTKVAQPQNKARSATAKKD